MRFFWRRHRSDSSLNDPLLADEDGSSEVSRQPGELDDLVAKFGRSLLNVSPKDISRLKAAVEDDDTEEISEIIESPSTSTNPTNNETEFSSIDISQDSLFKMAVDECKTEWVKFFLEKIRDKSIPFEVGAAMMKENFNNLWLDYKFLVEDLIQNDVLGWDICKIEVPLETFTIESNLGSRVGTCNSITEWLEASEAGAGLDHWRSLNSKGVDNVLQKSRERKVNATVRIYCFENACQIGLDGIVRLLLMHKASSSLFKTPLIKWIITFKWERVWRVHAFKRLVSFLVLFVGFHILVLFVTLEDFFPIPKACEIALGAFCISAVVLLPILTLRRECFQLKRCIFDARMTFPSNPFKGIRKYFGSRPNQIDLMLSVLMLVICAVPGLAVFRMYGTVGDRIIYSALAIAVLLMWAKGFYLSQAFGKSGIVVVMIERVLQECIPYFLVLFGITIGFALAMRIVFVDYLWEHEDSYGHRLMEINSSYRQPPTLRTFFTVKAALEDEKEENNGENFTTLYNSILTMTYAMVGLFDPEDLLHCGSWRAFVIAIFMVYLFLQSIIMFTMLIASMGDAFDGVKAAEEELFLMARAEFVDQYEASLSNKAIQKIRDKTRKYLYVLMPEDQQLKEKAAFWKGRIPTIKEDVTKIVRDSHNQLSQDMCEMNRNTYEMFKNLRDDIKSINEDINGFNDNIKRVEGRIMTLEKRISDQESNQ